MKSPAINLYQTVLTSWLAKQAFLRKFKRYWGTTTVNGVEVLSPKAVVHPTMSSRTRQLLKMLRLLDQVTSQKYKGVASAWLHLDANKASGVTVDTSDINRHINEYTSKLLTKAPENSTLQPRDYLHTFTIKVVSNGNTAPTVTPSNVATYLHTHKIDFDGTFAFMQFLLSPIEFTSTSRGRIAESRECTTSGDKYTVYVPVTVCTYKLTSRDFNKGAISLKLKEFLDMSVNSKRSVHNVSNHALNILNIQRSAAFVTTSQANGSMWYVDGPTTPPVGNSSEDSEASFTPPPVYLRADFLEDTSYTLDTRIEVITKAVSFGYKKKEADFWSKVAVFIVVIVAVVLSIPSGGMSLTAVATIAVIVSVTITVTALLMYSWGDYGGANFARATNKQISPLVQLAQFVLVINTGVDLAKAAKTATASAGQEAAKSTIERIVDNLLAKVDTKFILETLNYSIGMWSKNKVQQARRKNKKLQQEVSEFEEASKQSDLAQQFMDTYTKPLKIDGSVYAEQYDRPYEPTTPKFHIGNVQATTVTAFNRIS